MLPRMKNDIIDVMEACVDGTLDTIDLQFEDNACAVSYTHLPSNQLENMPYSITGPAILNI